MWKFRSLLMPDDPNEPLTKYASDETVTILASKARSSR
jgi:hypothetical protein